MGHFAYNAAIYLYGVVIAIASLFNRKAKLFWNGRKNIWKELNNRYPKKNVVWFHAASLGEFEQGKPVIESLKLAHPEINVLITFFSPSGYEIRKDYAQADVFYLPLDTPRNAKKFIETVQPKLAVFIRYEFWANYLDALYEQKVPTAVMAAQFRPDQFAFNVLGTFIRNRIKRLDKILVQYDSAKEVLLSNKFEEHKIKVCGDSRFDRVLQTARDAAEVEHISAFKGDSPLLIMGSGYQDEERFIADTYTKFKNWKFIYAPHFVDDAYIKHLINRLPGPAIRYTRYKSGPERILILDTIGKLASTYSYGDIAVVGGGFRDGIHNIIEPMAFGLPTFFGPNHEAFPEAQAAMNAGISWEIDKANSAQTRLFDLMSNPEALKEIKKKASTFVRNASGATQSIVEQLEILMK